MKKNPSFQQVESFDLNFLRQAFAEDRLFITPREESAQELRERGIHSILNYVSRIDDCTSSDYRPHIRDIWEQTLHDETLGELFFYTRYSHNRGEVNWYRVTVFVCLLHEWNVYRKDDFTDTYLHCLLEGTSKRNNHYTGMSRYQFDRKHFSLIRKKLQKIQQ